MHFEDGLDFDGLNQDFQQLLKGWNEPYYDPHDKQTYCQTV